jgi:hypothetical protein
MAGRDDLGASNVPAIDWLELSVWGALITMISVGVILFIR